MKSVLVIIACIEFVAAYQSSAQAMNTNDLHGGQDMVQTVRSRTVKLSIKDGKIVEEPKSPPAMSVYDIKGHKTEEIFYNYDGSLSARTVLVYDPSGMVIQHLKFDANNSLVSKTIYDRNTDDQRLEKSSYDSNNRLFERSISLYEKRGDHAVTSIFDADSRLLTKTVEFFDGKGRETEIFICHRKSADDKRARNNDDETIAASANSGQVNVSICGDMNLAGKVVINYNDDKHSIEHLVYTADGLLTAKKVNIKDSFGEIVEIADYTADGKLINKETFTREFDSHGNWIEQTRFQFNLRRGKLEPTERIYRELTYY